MTTRTTRASYKCCVSGITLNLEDSVTIESKIFSKRLVEAWTSIYGPSLPDGTACASAPVNTEMLLVQAATSLHERQCAFITNEFNSIATSILVGQDLSLHFTYVKVLIGFLLTIDPRLCLETVTKCASACELIDANEQFVSILRSVASGMLTLSKERVFGDLDELKIDNYEGLYSSILLDIMHYGL